jgi:hypothetical protein
VAAFDPRPVAGPAAGDADDAGAGEAERETVGAVDLGAPAAARGATGVATDVATDGAWVRGRAVGVTVAAGETAARRRTGGGSGAASGTGSGEDQAATAAPAAARRWTGRVGIAAWEVRLGTADGFATTSPGGADGPVSWPRGWTIGGSPRWPGTASRNGPDGATRGAPDTVR